MIDWKENAQFYEHYSNIVDLINLAIPGLNEVADTLGIKGSFDLDDPYNVYMRKSFQTIADVYVEKAGLQVSFKIDREFT